MMKIKKLLFPTNFEELSFPTVEALYKLKSSGLEEIVFLFVIDRDEVAFNLTTGFDKKLCDDMAEAARLRFADWEKELTREGLKSKSVVEVGTPEGKILEVSAREKVDIIISGRRRHVPPTMIYLSGTTMGVLRRTHLPVMVYRHVEECGLVVNPFMEILFATDFSPTAGRAFELVKRLAPSASNVHVVHVMTDRDFKRHSQEEIKEEEKRCLGLMGAMVEELKGLGIDSQAHLLAGHTVTDVLACCKDHRTTCIVMGTTGRHGIAEAWLGSASHRVAEQSMVSVILVPDKKESEY